MTPVDKIMALAEAWRTAGGREEHAARKDHLRNAIEALLEQPAAWVGLTDEERHEIMKLNYARTEWLVHATEAKLKEKNT